MKTNKQFDSVNANHDPILAVTFPTTHVTETKTEPTHEQIAVVAYQIYEEAGCPNGFAEGHWEAAETSLRREKFSGL